MINEDGPQEVLMQSTTGSSQLTIQAADNMAAKLVLAGSGAEEVERFSFMSTGVFLL